MTNKTVTIIGAGMAGLAAAYDLHRAGWSVTVLEARERVGGRMYSLHEFSNGLIAEGGGEFIDEDHLRMIAYAKEFNLSLGKVGSWQGQSGDWCYYEGKAGLASDATIWGFDLEGEVNKIWAAASKLGEFVKDPKHPNAAKNAKVLDAQSAAEWIAAQAVHPLARLEFSQHIRAEYTCEPQDFSLLDLARNAALFYKGEHEWSPAYRVIGGNDLIPKTIAARLPDVRLNAVVTSINIQAEQVAVTYKQGETHHTLTSAFAILATPLTTARLIDFNQSLPRAHRKMIDETKYGAVTKVLIEYKKRFWLDKGWNGRLSTDAPISYTWDATSHLDGDHGILTAYTGGGPGAKLSALSNAERTEVAISVIEKLFPGSAELIVNTATLAWTNEPYTRCSYMALAPNQVGKHWKTLFQPAGRLYFAGEHAAVFQGFMEGAAESGQRVAGELKSRD